MASVPEVKVSAEQILEAEQKQRALVLDPIVIASFGDFHATFKKYLSSSCKAAGCIGQSGPLSGLGGSQTGTSLSIEWNCNSCSSSAGSGK